jgi:outer membrane protein assembly factor BamB
MLSTTIDPDSGSVTRGQDGSRVTFGGSLVADTVLGRREDALLVGMRSGVQLVPYISTTTRPQIVLVHRDGRMLWARPGQSTSGATTISGDFVVFADGRLLLLAGDTGDPVWVSTTLLDDPTARVVGSPRILVDEELAIVTMLRESRDGSRELHVVAMDLQDGALQWAQTESVARTDFAMTDAAAASDRVYVLRCAGNTDASVAELHALDRDTGAADWTYVRADLPGNPSLCDVRRVAGRTIFSHSAWANGGQAVVLAVEADGTLAWQTERAAKRIGLIDACEDALLVGTEEGSFTDRLLRLDPATGALLWDVSRSNDIDDPTYAGYACTAGRLFRAGAAGGPGTPFVSRSVTNLSTGESLPSVNEQILLQDLPFAPTLSIFSGAMYAFDAARIDGKAVATLDSFDTATGANRWRFPVPIEPAEQLQAAWIGPGGTGRVALVAQKWTSPSTAFFRSFLFETWLIDAMSGVVMASSRTQPFCESQTIFKHVSFGSADTAAIYLHLDGGATFGCPTSTPAGIGRVATSGPNPAWWLPGSFGYPVPHADGALLRADSTPTSPATSIWVDGNGVARWTAPDMPGFQTNTLAVGNALLVARNVGTPLGVEVTRLTSAAPTPSWTTPIANPGGTVQDGIMTPLPGQDVLVTAARRGAGTSAAFMPVVRRLDATTGNVSWSVEPNAVGRDQNWTLRHPRGLPYSRYLQSSRSALQSQLAVERRVSLSRLDTDTSQIGGEHLLASHYARNGRPAPGFSVLAADDDGVLLFWNRSINGIARPTFGRFPLPPVGLGGDLSIMVLGDPAPSALGYDFEIELEVTNTGADSITSGRLATAPLDMLLNQGRAETVLASCTVNGAGACPDPTMTGGGNRFDLAAGSSLVLRYRVHAPVVSVANTDGNHGLYFIAEPPYAFADANLGNNVQVVRFRSGPFGHGFE